MRGNPIFPKWANKLKALQDNLMVLGGGFLDGLRCLKRC